MFYLMGFKNGAQAYGLAHRYVSGLTGAEVCTTYGSCVWKRELTGSAPLVLSVFFIHQHYFVGNDFGNIALVAFFVGIMTGV